MNALEKLLSKRKKRLLSIFFTAGYPKQDSTLNILETLQNTDKVDFVEIGIPFSDPIADGETIQKSNMAAINNDMRLSLLFEQLQSWKHNLHMPVILMGYLNPIYQYGIERFCRDCAEAGVAGIIVPDLPLEEYARYAKLFRQYNLIVNFLITPNTSNERIETIKGLSKGFIYAVSTHGTTGFQLSVSDANQAYFERIKTLNKQIPVMVGFGISNKHHLEMVWEYASGGIIGSAFLRALNTPNLSIEDATQTYIQQLYLK